jgi:hypothetical protein
MSGIGLCKLVSAKGILFVFAFDPCRARNIDSASLRRVFSRLIVAQSVSVLPTFGAALVGAENLESRRPLGILMTCLIFWALKPPRLAAPGFPDWGRFFG